MRQSEHFYDPVAAYDRLAADYVYLSQKREQYLRGIEREIIARIPPGSHSLLDLGAGDGSRASHIASQSKIDRVVLLEPSEKMAACNKTSVEICHSRAEELDPDSVSERFDAITCLWNVLGHIQGTERRCRALRAVSRLLSASGKFFLDVNHRYNLRHYGTFATTARWLHDRFVHNERNGDVLAKWTLGGSGISTYGHVFTHREIMRLAHGSGLEMEERIAVDYDDGSIRRFAFQGNLLYIFRRSSRKDSSSAPQTS